MRRVTILLLTFAVAACAGSGNDPTGQAWQLTELEGSALVDGTVIDLTITDTEASGSAGCNTYTGPVTFSGDGSMTLGPNFALTFMACDEAIMDQEQRYMNALTQVTDYQIATDVLRLVDDEGITVLEYSS